MFKFKKNIKIKKSKTLERVKKNNLKRGSEMIESMLLVAISMALVILAFYPEFKNLIQYMISHLNNFANNYILELMGEL